MADSRYRIDKQPKDNGFLELEGDPGPWIEANFASCLLVGILVLQLDYKDQIADSITQLKELTLLHINCYGFLHLPDAITTLLKLKNLWLHDCRLKELPKNLKELSLTVLYLETCDNITKLPANLGELKRLTNLHLSECNNLTALPETLGQLKSLINLHLSECNSLTKLPETLGDLESLSCLTLDRCNNIKSLPNSMKKLCNLRTLHIVNCKSITELPVDFKVLQLNLDGNSIKSLPKGFTCQHLELFNSADVLEHSNELVSIQRLTICEELDSDYCPTLNLNFNPSTLSIKAKGCSFIFKILASLDKLSGLMHLDLKNSIVKRLSWSMTGLRKLQILILPLEFRLESLLYHLNDSVVISVDYEHVRKTWKELTIEMEPWFSPVSGEVMAKEFPETSTSSVETLDLDLPVNLKHLTLRNAIVKGLPASMEKLTNLTALNLSRCTLDGLNPLGNLYHTIKLKLSHCSGFPSLLLPRFLRHLELLGSNLNERSLEECLNPLVNLVTLSVTCNKIKYFPSITGFYNLQELRLKDCFELEQLPPNLNNMVELRILDIIGTRISFLPNGILNLQMLQRLILPKWFKLNSLPMSLRKVSVIDHTPEPYYKIMHKDYPIATNGSYDILGVVETGFQGSEQQVNAEQPVMEFIAEQEFAHSRNNHHPSENWQNLNPQSDNASICEDSFEELQMELIDKQGLVHASENWQDKNCQSDSKRKTRLKDTSKEMIESCCARNMTLQQCTPCDENNHHASENALDKNPQHDSKHRDISKEMIESCWSRNMTLKKAAKEFGVSRSTLKRRKNKLNLMWRRVDANKKKPHIEQTTASAPPQQPGLQQFSISAPQQVPSLPPDAPPPSQHNIYPPPRTTLFPPSLTPPGTQRDAYFTQSGHIQQEQSQQFQMPPPAQHLQQPLSLIAPPQQYQSPPIPPYPQSRQHEQQPASGSSTNVRQNNGSSSMLVVKAAYYRDIVTFEFSSTNNIDKLFKDVGEMLKRDVASLKIMYLDEENDWVLMASPFNLRKALELSKISNVLRLLVVDY